MNANFTACKTAIDDNDARISTNTTAIAGLSGGGMAAAGVRVQVRFVTVPVVGTIPSVESSFNNLAATTPTVNRIGVGEYRVDFGGSTAGKMFMVTSGVGSGVTTGGANLLGLLYGTHIMSAIYDGAYANQVVVKAFDSAGAPVDTSFFLIVY